MSIYVKSLRSSSKGNCVLVWTENAQIAIDCGTGSQRDCEQLLRRQAGRIEDLDAVLVSHRHSDHINVSSLKVLSSHDVQIRAHQHVVKLANSRERNEYIAICYVSHREKYGKTILFADRWPQCEQLREALHKRGVKAGAIYSHIDVNHGTAEERNRRTADENSKVLQAFRDGELEVLINIRMATEGTDVPNAQTFFLTRQTTSQILLTQMVGRALRGPKFGGTERAYIVFIDNWKQHINWAAYDQLSPGLADESVTEYNARPPLQQISIDLVRRLARQMDSGINVNPAPYKAFLPIGWYRVEYYARAEGSDDIEPVSQLIMVFDAEQPAFEKFIHALEKEDLTSFSEDTTRLRS